MTTSCRRINFFSLSRESCGLGGKKLLAAMFVVSVALGTAQNEIFSCFLCLLGDFWLLIEAVTMGQLFFFTANGSHLSDALHGHLLEHVILEQMRTCSESNSMY